MIYLHPVNTRLSSRKCSCTNSATDGFSNTEQVTSHQSSNRISAAAATAAKSVQSCPTPWDPIDGSPPGSTVPRILQARVLEWVAITFSNTGKWKVKMKLLSRVWLFKTTWTAAYQAPPSMGFSVLLDDINSSLKIDWVLVESLCKDLISRLHNNPIVWKIR